jgi:hypothetical protein
VNQITILCVILRSEIRANTQASPAKSTPYSTVQAAASIGEDTRCYRRHLTLLLSVMLGFGCSAVLFGNRPKMISEGLPVECEAVHAGRGGIAGVRHLAVAWALAAQGGAEEYHRQALGWILFNAARTSNGIVVVIGRNYHSTNSSHTPTHSGMATRLNCILSIDGMKLVTTDNSNNENTTWDDWNTGQGEGKGC